jgi:phage terminase large subunit-like protein
MAETRLAQKTELVNKFYFDCNPPTKSHWLYSYFFLKINPETKTVHPRPDLYAEMRMNPEGNQANLPGDYIETVLNGLSERKRKRFRDGEWLDDIEGALWNRQMINATRVITAPKHLVRIIVSVDPAVTANENSNATGIIVVGIDERKHCYVLADRTQEQASPATWRNAAITAYHEFQADAVVGEVNNGGDLVKANIHAIDPMVRFRDVRASRGKIVRAEPVAGLYEEGKVHHVGEFPELEDEMCSYAPQLQTDETSPDRLDAMVWGVTHLFGKPQGVFAAA